MALAKYTPRNYYEGDDKGYYQFITMADVVSNFMVSYVGDDKIIKNTKRSEVSYHAQRAIQELSYDTSGHIKAIEIEVPPSLSMPIPHDFVSYVRLTAIDDAGLERPLKPADATYAPTPILQADDYTYLYGDQDNLLVATESETIKRFKKGDSGESKLQDASELTFLEEGYGYNVDYGKRYGLDPQKATKNDLFVIDQRRGVISFSSGVKGKLLILKYVSDGLNINDDMKVHKFAEEAIYKMIALAIMSAKANIPEYQVNRLKKEKRAALRVAKLRLANLNIEDLTQVMRGEYKQIKH